MAARSLQNLLAKKVLRDITYYEDNADNLTIITANGMSYVWDSVGSKAYIPFVNTQELNMLQMQEFQKHVLKENSNCSFILAICDTTGTILYYELTPNFVKKP